MRHLLLLLTLLLASSVWAQDANQNEAAAEDTSSTVDTSSETEEQRSIRALSLRELQEADEKMNVERERLAKSKRRIDMLLEDLNNRTTDLDTKTNSLKEMLDANKDDDNSDLPEIPIEQIDHWNSRDPLAAAKDFVILYDREPKVAVEIVKRMKKKKSAALVDAVSSLNNNGKIVAAKLHEAIGTGKVQNN